MTAHLPNGVYRISQWGTHEHSHVLTLKDGQVTVVPPGAAPERDQEWRLENLSEGKVAIQIPAQIFPSHSLSYEGEPEKGKRIIAGRLSDFPTREWHVQPSLQKPLPIPYFIRVPEKDLIVEVSPIFIEPPQLELGPGTNDLAKAWEFHYLHE